MLEWVRMLQVLLAANCQWRERNQNLGNTVDVGENYNASGEMSFFSFVSTFF